MKFPIKDFFSKYDQIHRRLRIWWHLLKKSLMENLVKNKKQKTCALFLSQIFFSLIKIISSQRKIPYPECYLLFVRFLYIIHIYTHYYALYISAIYKNIYVYSLPRTFFQRIIWFWNQTNIVKILTVISGVNRKDKLCYNLFWDRKK